MDKGIFLKYTPDFFEGKTIIWFEERYNYQIKSNQMFLAVGSTTQICVQLLVIIDYKTVFVINLVGNSGTRVVNFSCVDWQNTCWNTKTEDCLSVVGCWLLNSGDCAWVWCSPESGGTRIKFSESSGAEVRIFELVLWSFWNFQNWLCMNDSLISIWSVPAQQWLILDSYLRNILVHY